MLSGRNTTEKPVYAVCKGLYRVSKIGHSAKKALCRVSAIFVECHQSAKIRHSAKPLFAECLRSCTRQNRRTCPSRAPIVRRPWKQLTTISFAECVTSGTRQSQYFAECLLSALGNLCRVPNVRHSAKYSLFVALGKLFFFNFAFQFFSSLL